MNVNLSICSDEMMKVKHPMHHEGRKRMGDTTRTIFTLVLGVIISSLASWIILNGRRKQTEAAMRNRLEEELRLKTLRDKLRISRPDNIISMVRQQIIHRFHGTSERIEELVVDLYSLASKNGASSDEMKIAFEMMMETLKHVPVIVSLSDEPKNQ